MTNVTMVCILNCPDGKVTIKLIGDNDQENIDLQWKKLPNNEFGFITTYLDTPVRLTEVSAEYFLVMLLDMIIEKHKLSPDNIQIMNERGDELEYVKFIPPTFTGSLQDIETFVRKQIAIEDIMLRWEASNRLLNTDFLNVCNANEVLDDVLTLIQIMASRLTFSLKNLNKE